MTNAVDIKLRIENERLAKDLAKVERDFAKMKNKVSKDADEMGSSLQGAFGKLAVPAAVITGIVQLSQALAQTAKEVADLNDQAQSLGVGFEQFQELRYAAIQSGTSIENLGKAIGKMQIALGDATAKGAQFENAFSKIGLSIEKLNQLSPDEQFAEVAEAISNIKNPADRASAAMDIFGKSFRELIPLIKGGKDGLNNFATEAKRLGLVIDDVTKARMAKFDDSVETLTLKFNVMKTNALSPLVDFMNTEFDKQMDTSRTKVEKFLDTMELLSPGGFAKRLADYFANASAVEPPSVLLQGQNAEQQAAAREAAKKAYDAEEEAFKELNRKLAEDGRKQAEARAKGAVQRASSTAKSAAAAAKEAFVADWGSFAQLMADLGTEDEKQSYDYWYKRGEIILAGLKAGLQANSKEVQDLLNALDDKTNKDKLAASAAAAAEETALLAEQMAELQQRGKDLTQPFVDTFGAIVSGAQSAEDAVRSLLQQIITAIAQAAILQAFGLGSGSFGSTFGNLLGGTFGRSSGPNIRIYNQNPGGLVSTSRSSNGDTDIIIGQLATSISKGGNQFDSMLRRTYGLRRQGS